MGFCVLEVRKALFRSEDGKRDSEDEDSGDEDSREGSWKRDLRRGIAIRGSWEGLPLLILAIFRRGGDVGYVRFG